MFIFNTVINVHSKIEKKSSGSEETEEKLVFLAFIVAVQLLSFVQLFATPWTAAGQSSLSFIISWNLLKLMSIELVMPSNHLILCHPLLLMPSNSPASASFSMSWLFSSGGQSIGASASASLLPMYIQGWFPLRLIGLISLLSNNSPGLLQHNSKASILQHSAFFMVQLSHPYMTTGKTIALTRWTSWRTNVSAF